MAARLFYYILLPVVLLVNAPVLYARHQALRFESYSTENGLPQNSGYCIAQTDEGFMWFGTQNGLCRFDGYQWKVYKKSMTDSFSVSNNFIRAMVTDDAGNLWVGTGDGIVIYHPQSGKFFKPSSFFMIGTLLDKQTVSTFLKDRDNIWIYTPGRRLYRFTSKTHELKEYTLPQGEMAARSMALDESGRLWVSTTEDLYFLENDQFKPFNFSKYINKPMGNPELLDMAFTHGEMWVGSDNKGLFRFSMKGSPSLLAHLTTDSARWQFTDNQMECLIKDAKGNIWFGTAANGLYHYDYSTNQFVNGRHDDADVFSIRKNYVVSLFEDRQHIIWVGLSGGGIAKWDGDKNFFKNTLLTEKIAAPNKTDDMVLGLYNDGDSLFYIATQGAGMVISDNKLNSFKTFSHQENDNHSIVHNTVYNFAKDTLGNLWIASFGGLCTSVKAQNGTTQFVSFAHDSLPRQKSFYSIVKLRHKNALLLGGKNGLSLFDLDNNKWKNILDITGYAQQHQLVPVHITEPTLNPNEAENTGTVLLCTNGQGLLAYNYLTGTFKEYSGIKKITTTCRFVTKIYDQLWVCTDNGLVLTRFEPGDTALSYGSKQGLNDDVLYALLSDNKGRLWVSTNHGISCFDTTHKVFLNYGDLYGPANMEYNTAACMAAKNDQLYFGGVNGITTFIPGELPQNNYSPRPLITSLQIMNKDFVTTENISFTPAISLAYNENFITLHFAAPNFSQTSHTTYSYRLTGINNDWIEAGSSTVATYTNLPPGNYVFEVKSANNDGLGSTGATSLIIHINPPFWGTWWFKILCILLLVATLYYLYYRRITAIKRKADTEKQLSEYEMKALHAQMNPHFLFNCLNSIKEMIVKEDNEAASRYLSLFAQLIRDTLEESKLSFVSLRQTINYIERYIGMEQLRFDDFSATVQIEKNMIAEEITMPPMLIQPLVENAIWHGLRRKAGLKQLQVTFTKKEGYLICRIIDNGIGINQTEAEAIEKEHVSSGLDNIEKRLGLLKVKYGIDSRLTLTDRSTIDAAAQGTIVELQLSVE
ncbi:MAG: two-component regulator propeller domain-containing protein [Chitinophagaceae bacterium]